MRLDLVRSLVAGSVLLTSACASAGAQSPTLVTPASSFSSTAPGLVREPMTENRWWSRFQDPVLDGLVERALARNHTLAAQLEAVEASRALRRLRRAEQLPRGGPRADATTRRLSAHEAAGEARRLEATAVGLEAGWEVDLFGGARNASRAAAARQRVAELGFEHARLILAAEVVRTYVEVRGAEARRDVRRDTLHDQRRLVELNDALVSEGRVASDVVARSRAELHSLEAELLDDGERLTVLTHAIAVLVAEAPGRFELPSGAALSPLTVETIAIADPGALLQRRPDVRAAERSLAAEHIDVAAARAAYFPRVTLGGFFGLVAGTGTRLGAADAASWSVGPTLSWGLLSLGRTRARVAAERAEARAAISRYEETVLRALEEAENAVTRYGVAQAQLLARTQQSTFADVAADAALARYEEGAADHLAVLLARRDALDADLDRIDALVAHRVAVVSLFKALGAVPAEV